MVELANDSRQRFPSDWYIQPLGEIVESQPDAVKVNPAELYREIGIRSHGKGIFHKGPVSGLELGDKRVFWVKPNCLVFNIVFAWEGAVALTGPAEVGMIASHRFPMLAARDVNTADVMFLRRFFQTPSGVRRLGEASPGGAGRNRTLNQKFLGKIPVPVPPIEEQRKISAILSSVDDAIEAMQAVIDQLQVVKKAMMAELLTRGLPGRHAQFKHTEIGEVPEPWDVIPVGEILERIDAGWSPQCESGPAAPEEWGVLKISAVSWGEFREGENKRLPSEFVPRVQIEVKIGDVILSRANTPDLVGRAVIVRATRSKLMLSDKLLRLRVQPGRMDAGFLNLVLSSAHSRLQIEEGATGSSQSMKNISQETLRAIRVPVPSLHEQQQIVRLVDAAAERSTIALKYGASLIDLKTDLMSVLLSGELRVTPDPEPV